MSECTYHEPIEFEWTSAGIQLTRRGVEDCYERARLLVIHKHRVEVEQEANRLISERMKALREFIGGVKP